MNCKWIEVLLALVIVVFTFWDLSYSEWIVAVAAVLILGHALMCRTCHVEGRKK